MTSSSNDDKASAKAASEEIQVPAVAHLNEPGALPLQPIDRAATTARHTPSSPPDESGEAEAAARLSKASRLIITTLVILSNLTQFTCMFSTVAAGFTLSKALGHASGPGQANWMAAAYSLTQGAFVLVSGRLGAVYGHKKLLLLGGALLAVFSLANAFCTTYSSFVAVRALTGIGGGLVMPNAVATLTLMVPPGRARNITLAAFGASPPVGALIGALLAGLFLEVTEWKYLFILISLLAAVLFTTVFFVLPAEDPVDAHGAVDWIGSVLGLSSLALFNFAWNQAPTAGWQTPYVIATLALSLALFALFLVYEQRFAGAAPIMPLRVFATPTFGALTAVVLLTYMAFGISLWYMVAWQQAERGWSALQVAVGWIPFSVGAAGAVAAAGAWLVARLRAQSVLGVGVGACLASLLLLATVPARRPLQTYWAQTFAAIVVGSVCPDFVFVAAQIIASGSVGRRQQGVAASLVGTLNLYGNSLGLGFAGTVEVEVVRRTGQGEVAGYRAAFYFGAALAVVALVLDVAFVRVPRVEGEGWKSDEAADVPMAEGRRVSSGAVNGSQV